MAKKTAAETPFDRFLRDLSARHGISIGVTAVASGFTLTIKDLDDVQLARILDAIVTYGHILFPTRRA